MPAYLVAIGQEVPGLTSVGDKNAVVVFAQDADDARALAKMAFDGDANNAWGNATATEIAAATDLEGFRLNVKILDSTTVVDVTFTGLASADMDALGTGIVTLLNGDSQIANAAYVAGTNTLTIAGAADSLGDKQVEVNLLPPLSDTTFVQKDISIPGFIGAITDKGSAGDALTVVLADAANPLIYATLKS